MAVRIAGDWLDDEHRLDEFQADDQRLRATIELSYRTLPAPAQVALRRLGRLGYGTFPPGRWAREWRGWFTVPVPG